MPYMPNYQTSAGPESKFFDCTRVVRSRILYGVPVWAEDLPRSRRSLLLLKWLQRTTIIRIVRGYRIISHASASVLAASPPFELQALALRRVYHHLRGLCSGRDTPSTNQSFRDVREEARLETWEGWRIQLAAEDTVRPHQAVGAVLPNWEAWRDRGGLPLTYRMTQVLTGHGVYTAHARVLPCLGRTMSCPTTRHRREFGPRGDLKSHAEEATEVHRRPLLLRASHTRKGAHRERKGERTTSIERAVTPRRVWSPPRTCTTAQEEWSLLTPNQSRMSSDITIREKTKVCPGSNSQGVPGHSYQSSGRLPWGFSRFESDTTLTPPRRGQGVREDFPT